ncbi:MAG TPA: proline dehydrogenase family protein [Ignavibacteria bacterium]|nr:proline dehydrogenase family protein [Ignavibacteria bacterium]
MGFFNSLIVHTIPIFPKKIVKIFANKYIAGDNIKDAIKTVTNLNERNFMATVDVLGESITDKDEAKKSKNENIEVLDAIAEHKLNCNLSVKLTMMGLTIDKEFCYGLLKEIVDNANKKNIFVRIDMEDSSVTEDTIQIFERIRKDYTNVGIVIQAYLKRSEADIKRLIKIGANFRICKGIYVEPEEIAFKGYQEVRDNYLKILKIALEAGSYCGIATHDDYLIKGAEQIIKELGLSNDKYEFQMLLGVQERLRDETLKHGHRMRIYVPFGMRWYEYSIRRFKENPEVAKHVLKSIFSRG